MDNKKHPILDLQMALLTTNPGLVLEFSRYVHLGYGKTLSREIFRIDSELLSEEWLSKEESSLQGKQELALHSRVGYKGEVFHIPMIDFIGISSAVEVSEIMESANFLDGIIKSDMYLYDSGRSLHGYYLCLLDTGQWYQYLGKLLLCNRVFDPTSVDVIDSRWIGHSLDHGYSALRWSKNGSLYKSTPGFIGRLESKYTPATQINYSTSSK